MNKMRVYCVIRRLNARIHLSILKTRFLTVVVANSLRIYRFQMYTLNGSVVGLLVNCLISIVYRISIAAYWILYSEFAGFLVSIFDGQIRCKINRTSSKFTALNLNTVESQCMYSPARFLIQNAIFSDY